MSDFEKFKQLPISSQIAVISYLIGTLFFLCFFLFPKKDEIVISGLIYIIIAGIVNGISFLVLLYRLSREPTNHKNIVTEIAILLSNIPISILYLYIIINHLNQF